MDELRLLEGSYQSAVSALLKKYGPATDDYFSEKSYERFKMMRLRRSQKEKYQGQTRDCSATTSMRTNKF